MLTHGEHTHVDRVLRLDAPLLDDPPAHAAALAWVRSHGLDPDRMPIPQVVLIDDQARTIRCLTYVDGPDGQPRTNPGSGHLFMSEPLVVSLEAGAQPIPSVLDAWRTAQAGADDDRG